MTFNASSSIIYWLIYVIAFYCYFGIVECATHKCEIIGLTNGANWESNYFLEGQNDTIRGDIVTYKTKGITGMTITSTYLNAKFNKDKNELKILTSSAFENYEENETTNRLAMVLSFTCPGSNPEITIYQTITDINNHVPTFSKEGYEFKLPMPWPHNLDITLLESISVRDIDFSNRIITFEIDDNEYIEILPIKSTDFKNYLAILRPKTSLKLMSDLSLNIYATDQKDTFGIQHVKESVPIKIIIDKEGSVPPEPKFEKLSFEGKYNEDNTLELEDINIVKETYTPSIKIIMTGKYEKNFNLRQVKENKYQLEVVTPLDSDLWKTEKFITLNLKIENADTGSTIILKLVTSKSECPEIPVDCKMGLKFLAPLEVFVTISTNFKGEISHKQAIDFPESVITYTGVKIPNFVKVGKETGIVTVENSGYILKGLYEFQIKAENEEKENYYKINLLVQHKAVTPENALTVLTIPESKVKENLIKLSDIDAKQKCKFEIIKTTPEGIEPKWIAINSKTGNIDVQAINRTDDLFKNMYREEVQLQLSLKVNCAADSKGLRFMELFNISTKHDRNVIQILNSMHGVKNRRKLWTKDDDDLKWIFTNRIVQNSEQMIVNIRIDNTDNHAPIFVEGETLNIGYPNVALTEAIHPPYVYQVHAIDQDIGLNGEIKYKLESIDSLFLIHPTTGIIYPSKKLPSFTDSKISITAMAIDRAGDGLSTNLPITVYILKLEQVSVMKIEKALLENLPEILQELSKATEWSVRQLTSAVIPENVIHSTSLVDTFSESVSRTVRKLTGFLAASEDALLTIYTYSFSKDNEIVSADDFAEKMKEINIEHVEWSVESVKPHSNNTITEIIVETKTDKRLLIGIIILSITLVGFIIGSIFYLKNRNKQRNDLVLATELPSINIDQSIAETKEEKPRVSVLLNDNLIGATNDHGDSRNNSLRVNNSLRERKKSAVTFNDEVEHIELTESDPQPESNGKI